MVVGWCWIGTAGRMRTSLISLYGRTFLTRCCNLFNVCSQFITASLSKNSPNKIHSPSQNMLATILPSEVSTSPKVSTSPAEVSTSPGLICHPPTFLFLGAWRMNSSRFAAHEELKHGAREELRDLSTSSFTRPAYCFTKTWKKYVENEAAFVGK